MAGKWRQLMGLGVLLLVNAGDAGAYSVRTSLWYVPPVTSYYYLPTPIYGYSWAPSYTCPSAAGVTVIPLEGPGNFANPIPAPPSPTTEPPLNKKPAKASMDSSEKPPTIITTRALSPHALSGAPLAKDHCRVGIWNLSGREVTLTVEGKAWTLSKDRSIVVELERNFAWQVGQGPQHVERIPENQTAYELIIRE